jgi:hypothetical protein
MTSEPHFKLPGSSIFTLERLTPAKLGSTDRSIDVSSLKILQEDPRKDQKSNPTAIPAIHADLLLGAEVICRFMTLGQQVSCICYIHRPPGHPPPSCRDASTGRRGMIPARGRSKALILLVKMIESSLEISVKITIVAHFLVVVSLASSMNRQQAHVDR